MLGERLSGILNVHFPDVLVFNILKSIISPVFGQHGETQKFRFLPASQDPDDGMPGPCQLETPRGDMQTVTGIGLHRVGQSIDSWLVSGQVAETVDKSKITGLF